ncbi:hypothetical protein SMICM304S_05490 [Streptomyces microflavus]
MDELAAVHLPVHVLSGERDDAWPVEQFDAMARRLGARRTTIAGAERLPQHRQAGATTAEALAAFWDSVDRGLSRRRRPPASTSVRQGAARPAMARYSDCNCCQNPSRSAPAPMRVAAQ